MGCRSVLLVEVAVLGTEPVGIDQSLIACICPTENDGSERA